MTCVDALGQIEAVLKCGIRSLCRGSRRGRDSIIEALYTTIPVTPYTGSPGHKKVPPNEQHRRSAVAARQRSTASPSSSRVRLREEVVAAQISKCTLACGSRQRRINHDGVTIVMCTRLSGLQRTAVPAAELLSAHHGSVAQRKDEQSCQGQRLVVQIQPMGEKECT